MSITLPRKARILGAAAAIALGGVAVPVLIGSPAFANETCVSPHYTTHTFEIQCEGKDPETMGWATAVCTRIDTGVTRQGQHRPGPHDGGSRLLQH